MIKLLVVDDEPGICDIIKKTFTPTGFTVLTAYSGKEALAVVKKEKPKLVFLDIRMFGMSGLEVLKEIKQFDNSIKVIMITVMDDEKTKEEAKRLGADEFITKPFKSDYLEDVVRSKIDELISKE
ncbi:MAG: response regulator [Candidatus Omnitrophota bacterium]